MKATEKQNIKKIIIVGAGVSGLTAGIYAQKHGFISEIYEKNPTNGGLCTTWNRKDMKIDGCIHWLTGTKENTDINKLWKEVDAFDSDDIIHPDNFGSIEYNGKVFTFWCDLDRLEKELIEISPKDKRLIKRLKKLTIRFYKMPLPLKKPLSTLNVFDLLKYGVKMIPYLPSFIYAINISQSRFAKKFKSQELAYILSKIVPGSGNLYTTLYAYGTVIFGNGGVIRGGSQTLINRLEDNYRRLGGIIHNNSEVSELIVDNKKATAMKLKNGKIIEGDYFVTCVDAYEATRKLIKSDKRDHHLSKRFIKLDKYPLPSAVYISFSVSVEKLKSLNITSTYEFPCSPFTVAKKQECSIKIRDYSYDNSFIKDGRVLLTVLVHQDDRDYYYWKKLHDNYKDYLKEKNLIANNVKERIEERFPSLKNDLILLDVTSPITYARYVNAYRGAYMPWSFTADGRQLMHNSKMRGLKNVIFSGQWIIMPGGIPIALISGKFAIQLIAKKEHKSMYLPKTYQYHLSK